jgi:hypothetical protein
MKGRQVGIAKKVIGASAEGRRIDPVPEMSNLESWRNKATQISDDDKSLQRQKKGPSTGRRTSIS